jgi:hypothetical protein
MGDFLCSFAYAKDKPKANKHSIVQFELLTMLKIRIFLNVTWSNGYVVTDVSMDPTASILEGQAVPDWCLPSK